VLEKVIDFACELSVVAVRGLDGSFASYGPILNDHRHHILDVSVMPAPIEPPLTPQIAQEAVAIARSVVEALGVVGVLCVEYFLDRSGNLMINELAPRPHNSGHLTVDACLCGQFEQQVRAVCGLPLGDPSPHSPAAMANLLGDLWPQATQHPEPNALDGAPAQPPWPRVLAEPGLSLHLYGKREARPGRKMGHLTTLAPTAQGARRHAIAARAMLVGNEPG
jgi:5-(carboxyamino)imidazole ribonucleotide synthase